MQKLENVPQTAMIIIGGVRSILIKYEITMTSFIFLSGLINECIL